MSGKSTEDNLRDEIASLKEMLSAEQQARMSVDNSLQMKSFELYKSNQELHQLNEDLEKNILKRTSMLSYLIQNLHEGILLEDENRKVLLVNEAFLDCFDLHGKVEDLIGANYAELRMQPNKLFENPGAFVENLNQIISKREKVVGEVIKMLNGKVLERDFVPIYRGEEYVGHLWKYADITKKKHYEDELKHAWEIAENARAAEKDFLANMSHEIRNPINAIAGLINLLYDTPLQSEQLEYLDNVKYAADILVGLISDVLDLSKIESGKMEVNEQELSLHESIGAIIQTFKFSNDKSVLFNYEIDPELDFNVLCDSTILNQILLNLVGNASKFTEKGEVFVKVDLIENLDEEVNVRFTISDTGIGIDEEQLNDIFESFKQGSKQTKLKYGGTGLGLSIVKRLVSIYQGEIDVKSKIGVGSSFLFNMILKRSKVIKPKKPVQSKKPVLPEEIKHILVVEDSKMNQQYLTSLLDKWGITYHIANHGGIAIDLIAKYEYDLILMDIRMPVMDGYETTIWIRNSKNNPNSEIPIIALTASALVDERDKAIAAGMNFHLTKPFSADQLLEILKQVSQNEIGDGQETSENIEFSFSTSLDAEYLDIYYEDDLKRAQRLFQIFIESIDVDIAKVLMSFRDENCKELNAVAHRIKASFKMVGLSELSEDCFAIEQAAKGNDTQILKKIVPDFLNKFKIKRQIVVEELSRINKWMV